jgi:hypothetical protein
MTGRNGDYKSARTRGEQVGQRFMTRMEGERDRIREKDRTREKAGLERR